MPRIHRIGMVLILMTIVSACATTSARYPITDVPAGEYVLVEPASDVYWAVNLNERAYTVRMDDDISSGEHWVDDAGMLHMAAETGPCAGIESIWDYDYAGNRIVLDLVEDRCDARMDPLPDRMVWERN